jgi:hypothetical protein
MLTTSYNVPSADGRDVKSAARKRSLIGILHQLYFYSGKN